MPLTSKPNNRQAGTPSPTPGDVLNTLLIVKDTVNATLLNEHTKLADLSNLLSEVEDQIRNAAEQTIKNLKADFEKRRRKIVPGIKRLQDSLKSLSKSESRCKASERTCKNADAKKAKRRIKDAQKTLQDFTAYDIELGIVNIVADQITVLCQQLMQISPKLKRDDPRYESCELRHNEKSDTDSEGSSRVNTPTSHIYSEIDISQSRNSTYITPRRSTCIISDGAEIKIESSEKGSPIRRLNSVVLFSSDSEDDYGFDSSKKKHQHHSKRTKATSESKRQPRSHRKSQQHKSKSPDYEILDKPTKLDLFRGSISTRLSPSRVGLIRVKTPSPIIFDDYEKPVKREHESLGEPIKEYMKRMSPALKSEHENSDKEITNNMSESPNTNIESSLSKPVVNKTKDELSPSSNRATPKRLLPATPRHVPENKEEIKNDSSHQRFQSTYFHPKFREDATDDVDASFLEDTIESVCLSTANNTVELLNAAQLLLENTKITSMPGDVNSDKESSNIENETDKNNSGTEISQETDYIDIEEIKFRETVRSARREIIDKLKSKYAHTNNTPSVSTKGRTDIKAERNNLQNSLRKYGFTTDSVSRSLNPYDKGFQNTTEGKSIDTNIENSMVYSKLLSQSSENVDLQNDSSAGVYRGKLVYTTYDSNCDSDSGYHENSTNASNSSVTSRIKMFEMASAKDCYASSRARRHKPVLKYGNGARYRSISEPRTSVTSLRQNSQDFFSMQKQSNKALEPRFGFQHIEQSGAENGDMNCGDSLNLTRSCTENDLLNLVRNESSSSIRKQWTKRRSSSMTPKIPDTRNKSGPSYEYWLSISIPEQTTRCFISAIVILSDRSIVLLDERHSFLHLFDRAFKHRDQYRLLDTPKSCVKVNSNTVAVAFPYKKCICTYCIQMGAILSGNEISFPCKAWIVDVKFSKKLLYVMCKAGEIHILKENGLETQRINVGMTGFLFVPPAAKCLFVLGEGRVSKFDTNGTLKSSKADIDAHSMIYLENRIYVADRQRHKITPLSESADVLKLIDIKIEYPSAMCSSLTDDVLLVSQFEESMDVALTRTVKVLKLKRT